MKKNIFSKILVAVALVAAPIAMSSCSNEDNFWTEAITISGSGVQHHEATIVKGQTLQLKATTGILVTGNEFAWSSSNTEVATVDQNGLVKALKAGETTIAAQTINVDVSNTGSIRVKVINQGLDLVDDKIDQSEAE